MSDSQLCSARPDAQHQEVDRDGEDSEAEAEEERGWLDQGGAPGVVVGMVAERAF
ncbi:hypothetical protein [Streptomyces sp. NPDC086010]|uniref:hypothetical protein n=1 Tax=Streptomyces sp. NPDC086010 TaxID=3365745 RepID=UPI0037D75D3E